MDWQEPPGATERFGRVDVMVANAGTAGDAGRMAEHLPNELFLA